MFIRWKIQKRANEWENGRRNKPVQLHIAYLVESVRVKGKPRQRTIAYLASIKDRFIPYVMHQAYFWARVEAALDPLDLTEVQRQAIKQKLQERVPRPDEEKVQAELRARKAMFGH